MKKKKFRAQKINYKTEPHSCKSQQSRITWGLDQCYVTSRDGACFSGEPLVASWPVLLKSKSDSHQMIHQTTNNTNGHPRRQSIQKCLRYGRAHSVRVTLATRFWQYPCGRHGGPLLVTRLYLCLCNPQESSPRCQRLSHQSAINYLPQNSGNQQNNQPATDETNVLLNVKDSL